MPSEKGKLDAYMEKKVQASIERLKLASEMSETFYHSHLLITYSGGKDSDTILSLAEESGIDFEVVMSLTTVEAPVTMIHAHETARRVREEGKTFTFHYARDKDGKPLNMHDVAMKKKMLPTRVMRYCCETFKEISTPNRLVALGVRAEESVKRAKNYDIFSNWSRTDSDGRKLTYSFDHARGVFDDALKASEMLGQNPDEESAYDCLLITEAKRKGRITVQHILDWTNSDVWEYIRGRGIKYNPIYDMGYSRCGCIGCPLASPKMRQREFDDFPGLEKYWRRIADDLIRIHGPYTKSKIGLIDTGEKAFDWWMEKFKDDTYGQATIFDFMDQEEQI